MAIGPLDQLALNSILAVYGGPQRWLDSPPAPATAQSRTSVAAAAAQGASQTGQAVTRDAKALASLRQQLTSTLFTQLSSLVSPSPRANSVTLSLQGNPYLAYASAVTYPNGSRSGATFSFLV